MDLETYRASEAQGRLAIRSIRNAAIHRPETFESGKFPTRIACQDDLAAYLDVMHEDHFKPFVAEMDGLLDAEIEELLDGLLDYCKFYMAHFAHRSIPIPLSGMIAQYCLVRKIRNIKAHATILEIGPGSGLQTFFLAKELGVQRYDQIEAVEPFYLLQSLIGTHLYRHRYFDHAQIAGEDIGLGGLAMNEILGIRPDIFGWSERTFALPADRTPACEHFPWWQLGKVMERRYDIVTANANLTEFSEEALRYYSALIRKVLKPDGVFLAQCPGGGTIQPGVAFKTFLSTGFVPLAIAGTFDTPQGPTKFRTLGVTNLLFLPREHPLAPTITFQPNVQSHINIRDPMTRAIFSMDRAPGRHLTQDDLLSMVAERLGKLT